MSTLVHAPLRRPRLDHLPGPRGFDFVRDMLHFRRDSLGALEDCYRRFGPVVAFGWPINTVILYEPRDIRRVLVDNHANYKKGAQTKELQVVMGQGLVTNDDRVSWSRRRLLVNQALSARAVRLAMPLVDALAEQAASRLEGDVNVSQAMRRLTFTIAARVFFGAELTDDEARRIDAAVLYASHVVHLHMFQLVGFPYAFPTPTHLRFHAHCKNLDAIVQRLISHAKAHPNEGGVSILARLVQARDPETNAPLSDIELRDEIVTLLVAGYETTANTLTWTLGLLAMHPDAQARVRDEVISQGHSTDVTTFAKTHPYTHAVLLESMRLYTAIPMSSHRTLDEDSLGGHRIPANTNVVIPTWVIHRDPLHWPSAASFTPERFTGCPMHRKDAYLPFSKGERGCIGQVFAMMELASIVTHIVERQGITPIDRALPRAVSEVSLKPEGTFRLRFTRRGFA